MASLLKYIPGGMSFLFGMMVTVLLLRIILMEPTKPTTHLFMSGDAMCCTASFFSYRTPITLYCGKIRLDGASNYIDTGKPCEAP
jgi:hypothetical protein